MQFLLYVVLMLYFEKQHAGLLTQFGETRGHLKTRQAEIEENGRLLIKLRQDELKKKLVHFRKIIELSRENRLWREVIVGILQQGAKDEGSAKRLLGVILRKAGIKLTKVPDEIDEEELLEEIKEAKSASLL